MFTCPIMFNIPMYGCVTSCMYDDVRNFRLELKRIISVPEIRQVIISNIILHPAGKRLLIQTRDSVIRMMDLHTTAIIQWFRVSNKYIYIKVGICCSGTNRWECYNYVTLWVVNKASPYAPRHNTLIIFSFKLLQYSQSQCYCQKNNLFGVGTSSVPRSPLSRSL